ncbi:MAG: AAA family ATPase [Anaerolineaceae bacterium]|nr:AAA family ATPase [Anaerolineaceae bacterium]
MFRVLLLGAPLVFQDDQPVFIQRRLLRAMLFYLALQPELLGRSDLMTLFWPELPEEKSRLHLRDTLSKLRFELPDPSIFVVDRDNIGLDRSRLYVDVYEFNQLVNQTHRSLAQLDRSVPLPDSVYQQVERATNLWRSEHFLAGARLPAAEGFGHWVIEKSRDLKYSRLYLLERLADHAAAVGDLEAGIKWVRSALEVDEINTDLNYRLLSWLNDLGKRGEALNHYKRLEFKVKKELGGELLPAIIELQKKIRSQSNLVESVNRPIMPASPVNNLPMFGQNRAIREIKLAFQRGGVVTVFGEAGSGKSRLVNEAIRALQPVPRILLAQARPLEGNLPFQPLIELMRHSIHSFEWNKLDTIWISQLARLLPELSVMRSDVMQPIQVDKVENRSILFESMHHLFLKLFDKRRVLFLLENAHWADQATFQSLAYLLERNFFIKHGLLVISARVEIHNPFLDEFLTHSNPYSPPTQINLEPLGLDEISDLSTCVLGYSLPPQVIQNLSGDTGGNPLLLLETLRTLLEISPNPNLPLNIDHFPIPSSIHAVIRERLSLLDPPTLQVLTTAAVIGDEFTPELLEFSTSLDSEEIARVLESLEKSHLLQARQPGSRDSSYTFIHKRVREVLLMELSPARKRVFHLRIAHALETRSGSSSHLGAVLAHHYEKAGEFQSAFNYWLRAGDYARQLSSPSEIYSAYNHAEMLAQQPDLLLPEQAIYQLYSSWGEVAAEQDDVKTMHQIFTTMQQIGEQRRSSILIGSGLSGQVLTSIFEKKPQGALEKIEQAIFYLEQAGDLFEQVQANNRQAMVLLLLHNNLDALSGFQKTIEIGKKSSNPRVQQAVIDAERQMALTYNMLGWPIRAIESAQLSLRASQRSFYNLGCLRAYEYLSWSLFSASWYESALENSRYGIQIAQKLGNSSVHAHLDLLMSRAALALGKLDDSWIYMQSAAAIAQQHQLREVQSAYQSVIGNFYKELQDYPKAVEAYQTSLDGKNLQSQALQDQCSLAEALLLNGNESECFDSLRRITQLTRESEISSVSLPGDLVLSRYFLSNGNLEESRQLADSVFFEATQRSLTAVAINAELLLGSIENIGDNLTKASTYALKAIERSREIANPWLELKGLFLLRDLSSKGCQFDLDPLERAQELFTSLRTNVSNPEILAISEKFIQNSFEKMG